MTARASSSAAAVGENAASADRSARDGSASCRRKPKRRGLAALGSERADRPNRPMPSSMSSRRPAPQHQLQQPGTRECRPATPKAGILDQIVVPATRQLSCAAGSRPVRRWRRGRACARGVSIIAHSALSFGRLLLVEHPVGVEVVSASSTLGSSIAFGGRAAAAFSVEAPFARERIHPHERLLCSAPARDASSQRGSLPDPRHLGRPHRILQVDHHRVEEATPLGERLAHLSGD